MNLVNRYLEKTQVRTSQNATLLDSHKSGTDIRVFMHGQEIAQMQSISSNHIADGSITASRLSNEVVNEMVSELNEQLRRAIVRQLTMYNGRMATPEAGDRFYNIETGLTYMFDNETRKFVEVPQ